MATTERDFYQVLGVERTAVAQDQAQALLAAELVLTAQKNATRPKLG